MSKTPTKEELSWRLLSEKYEALSPAAQRLIDAHVKEAEINDEGAAAIEARNAGSMSEDEFTAFRDAHHIDWLAANAEYNAANAALNEEYAAINAARNKGETDANIH